MVRFDCICFLTSSLNILALILNNQLYHDFQLLTRLTNQEVLLLGIFPENKEEHKI
jgi:hypothetical protein